MNIRSTFKDIKVQDRDYRINKMDSRLACWLFSTLAAKADNGQILTALGKCTKIEFDEIQAQTLRFILSLEFKDGNLFPSVVIQNGIWADKELESNAADLFTLMTECILYNVAPFLKESA